MVTCVHRQARQQNQVAINNIANNTSEHPSSCQLTRSFYIFSSLSSSKIDGCLDSRCSLPLTGNVTWLDFRFIQVRCIAIISPSKEFDFKMEILHLKHTSEGMYVGKKVTDMLPRSNFPGHPSTRNERNTSILYADLLIFFFNGNSHLQKQISRIDDFHNKAHYFDLMIKYGKSTRNVVLSIR